MNGVAPGISATFLNNLETYLHYGADSNITADGNGKLTLVVLNANPAPVVLNGGTSGTATLWQDCTGSIKRILIFLSNFRTAATAQSLVLPTPFVSGGIIRTGFTGDSATASSISLMLSGVAQTIYLISSLGATDIGGTTQATGMYGFGMGELRNGTGFDTVQFKANGTSAHTGFIEMVGH